jgi:hypothetical protein
MFVPFESLVPTARVWIYQANREFTGAEEEVISDTMRSFCDQWQAHGNTLQTSFRIDYHHFLVVAVDEGFNDASGCSIDGSVLGLKSLQNQLSLDFFDRTKISFLIEGKVALLPAKDLKASFSSGILSPSSLTFNTLVTTVGGWESHPMSPARETWLAKYLPAPAVAR